MVTRPAADLIERLARTYRAAADPARAAPMVAYMRNQFAFLGLSRPVRSKLDRTVFSGHQLTPAEALDLAEWCWEQDQREFQYAACDALRKVARKLPAAALLDIRQLIQHRSWWDTVDTLAANVVGPMVLAHPELSDAMDEWIDDPDLWVARTAILHQLSYKERTDVDRLVAHCLRRADHPDFFIRKAIGWALRQYARTDPDEVRRVLAEHGGKLSPLSMREASKHL